MWNECRLRKRLLEWSCRCLSEMKSDFSFTINDKFLKKILTSRCIIHKGNICSAESGTIFVRTGIIIVVVGTIYVCTGVAVCVVVQNKRSNIEIL